MLLQRSFPTKVKLTDIMKSAIFSVWEWFSIFCSYFS